MRSGRPCERATRSPGPRHCALRTGAAGHRDGDGVVEDADPRVAFAASGDRDADAEVDVAARRETAGEIDAGAGVPARAQLALAAGLRREVPVRTGPHLRAVEDDLHVVVPDGPLE